MDGVGLSLLRGKDKLVLGKLPYHKEVFDLATDPELVPARFGGPDQRSLGIFLTSVCLGPVTGGSMTVPAVASSR